MSDSQIVPNTESAYIAKVAVAWEITQLVATSMRRDQDTPEEIAARLVKIFNQTLQDMN